MLGVCRSCPLTPGHESLSGCVRAAGFIYVFSSFRSTCSVALLRYWPAGQAPFGGSSLFAHSIAGAPLLRCGRLVNWHDLLARSTFVKATVKLAPYLPSVRRAGRSGRVCVVRCRAGVGCLPPRDRAGLRSTAVRAAEQSWVVCDQLSNTDGLGGSLVSAAGTGGGAQQQTT